MIFPRQIFSTKFCNSSSSPSNPPFGSSSKIFSPQTLLKSCVSPCIQSLNIFLSSLLRSGRLTLLLETFSQLSSNSIQIDSKTHFLVTQALLRSRRFEEAQQFISAAEKYDFIGRKNLWDSLIREVCVSGGDPERALSLLRECTPSSLITFRSLVLSFSAQGKMDKAIEVLEIMTSEEVGFPFDNFVCSSIISGFSRIGNSDLGLGFYDKVQKSLNFQPNLMTYTAVVDALCRGGRIDEASGVVEKMKKDLVLDVVLYTCWIRGYFRKGLLMEAFRKHRLMSETGILPDVISYTSAIDSLCKEGHLEKVIGLLKYMEKSGLKPNLITYTCIMRGFCKKRKMEEAFFILRKMDELNVVADEFFYSVLIDGFCTIGELDEVFELLKEMERKGIKATAMTYNTVVNGLCKAGKTSMADEISRNYGGDNFTYSTLLHAYMMEKDAQGVIDTKRRLEQAGIPFDVVTVNILIKALFTIDMVDDASSLFEEITERGLIADSFTYCAMVDGYCKHGMADRALEVFMDYKRTSAFVNDACHNLMIVGLCKEERVGMATELFLELCESNIVADTITYRKLMKARFKEGNWEDVLKLISKVERCGDPEILSSLCNDSVSFLCRRECFPAALEVYFLMRLKGLTVWSKSYYILLKSLINGGNGLIIELVFCDYIKACGVFEPGMVNITCLYLCKKNVEEAVRFLPGLSKRNLSLGVLTVVINTLKEKGRVQEALDFLLEAEENSVATDVVVYSIIVDGLCKGGFLEKALDLCSKMRKKGIAPNIATYNSVIHGLCREGCLVEAFRVFDSLEFNGLFPTTVTYATLIGALSGEGFLQDAEQLLGRMAVNGISPNMRIFNSLINGYCRFGLLEEGIRLVRDLAGRSLEPDGFTISSLIIGHCAKGDVQGCLNFYNAYREKGYSPDLLGFLSLIKGLSAKGRMEEARNIIRDMLQHREACDLINKAGDELNFESLATFIKLACEEGRLQEVINVLTDVGSKFLTLMGSKNSNGIKDVRKAYTSGGLTMAAVPRNTLHGGEDCITERKQGPCENKNADSVMNECRILCQNSLKHDFETCYSIIATLCSRGELQEANDMVKETVLSLGK